MNINNNQRKKILEKLDENIEVNNDYLTMFGLTAYMKDNKSNTGLSLLDYKLNNHFNKRRLIHNSQISLMPEQYNILNKLNDYDKILLMAPTSFGKSLLIKEYIWNNKPKSVVYIVPTNALADELETYYKKYFSEEYEIFDSLKEGENYESDKKQLFIGTQEKLMKFKDIMNEIDLFIIDEAYKLKETINDTRGLILSKSILEMGIQSKKIILLLPNAKVSGLEEYEFKEISTMFNAVDSDYIEFDDIVSKLNMVQANNEKSIVYFNYPSNISDYVDNLNDKEIDETKFMKHLREEYSEAFSVYKGLKKGVIIHHGQMPKYIQNKQINDFNKDDNSNLILFGTRSISEGINTPTKNIIFHEGVNILKDKMLIKNTIGRAGRLGKYPIGKIHGSRKQIKDLNSIDEIEILVDFTKDDNIEKATTEGRINKIKDKLNEKNIEITREDIIDLEKTNISINVIDRYVDFYYSDINFNETSEGELYAMDAIFKIHNYLYADNSPSNFSYLHELDKELINTMFFLYKQIDGVEYYFNIFNNKIDYIEKYQYFHKERIKEQYHLSKTKIIDKYFKYRYSILEYKIMPIITLTEILGKYLTEPKHDIIKSNIMDTRRRYALYVMKNESFNEMNSNLKEIYLKLSEYGIPMNKIDKEMVESIFEKLNNRYSMYDIKHAIRDIYEETRNSKFKLLLDYYI